ncbi:MAG: TMEM165/GDT1 family protein [Thiohalocapsa sp.]|jgi:putative Ca2+/H+ antiporter (TMEM165/GDT1 family)|uniref:TMEM165/GDT1 family protein n=1 Tax=Thiohalocapsa sp. TaxID=2497641 RepID=UPI0025CC31F1|nr:TMEM165/GDT1 family protein [Thiohalocapsa sp.]MCG6941659.1 TMEM165/GDT1 family protein [Thiohalocapsa sp.]
MTATAMTFGLIFVAEVGDKSQLVCMALAARYHHRPVLLGALTAFVVLNSLAVAVGAGLAHWVPERLLAAGVATLFALFGVLSLRADAADDTEQIAERRGYGVFATTFLMLFLAEMGDKTQLAVAGMTGTLPAASVWVGATLALGATSALAVLVGHRLLRRIPLHRLHQISGIFFLSFAALALTKVF